jgi:hypothetical protein
MADCAALFQCSLRDDAYRIIKFAEMDDSMQEWLILSRFNKNACWDRYLYLEAIGQPQVYPQILWINYSNSNLNKYVKKIMVKPAVKYLNA